MNDDELAQVVAGYADESRMSAAGVQAQFALAKLLEGEPEFAGRPPRTVRSSLGAHGVSPPFVAQRMLQLATTQSPAAAVAWLRKIPGLEVGTGGAVKALYGVTCAEPVQISEDIVLLPFDKVPESTMRTYVLERYQADVQSPSFRPFVQPPYAALYRRGTIEPLTVDTGASTFQDSSDMWFRSLDDAALLLSLVPKSIPIEAVRWFHYDDPDVALLCQFGVGRYGGDIEPNGYVEPMQITSESVVGLLSSFDQLKKGDRERITLALQRIIRSRSQLHPGNRAIDLAIALEVLFMNAQRDEHSYKISLRAARLLRTSLEDRRAVTAEIKKIYEIRSGMVHSGSTSNLWNVNGTQRSVYELVESADMLCIQSIKKFLSMRAIPEDWRDIELS